MSKKKVLVFLDVCIDGDPFERMVFELFTDVAPKTAENFRALCTGEKGTSPKTGATLHYKGTFFHHIVKGSMAQAGDLLREDGNFGESIYGGKFPDELPKLKHDSPGLLSMAIADRDIRGSLFMVTFNALHHLDRKSVVFGKLVHGHEVLKKIENVGNEVGKPDVTVKIVNSGELHEGRHKGKHKKTSKERRRKRRRYYTSDSDSSTDSETESSESDSDSDSYISSSTDTSSSSDDRRRKRKRSKREKNRRGKRRDRRRERRRKKRDKKLKRRPRNSSDDILSEGDSGSSSEEGDAKTHEPDGKHTNLGKIPDGNQSHHVEEREAVPVHQMKGEAMGSREREEDEFPKENGGHKNNDLMQNKSDKSPVRQPDVVDNSPSKSRSRSLSPKRTLNKSMSISPRSFSRNQSDSPRRSVSRSASVNASPRRVSDRSSSPVKRGNRNPTRSVSGSPATGKRGRSVSESPSPITNFRKGRNRSPSPRRLNGSPPRTSSKKSWKSASRSPVRSSRIPSRSPVRSSRRSLSRSPVRSSRRSMSRSPVRSSRRSVSRSPVRSSRRSVSRSPVRSSRRSVSRSPVRSSRRSVSRSPVRSSRRSVSRSPVRSSRRSVSRSSGRVPSRRGPSRSPVRAPYRRSLRSHSRSPGSTGRRERSPISDRGRSSSKSPSGDGSPKRIRRGRGFSEQYSFVRRYRSRSPVRSYRYGRSDRDRYSSYRRSPRRYRSPPRGRTPPRFRNGRSRSRSISRSPIRYRGRRYSRSPIRSRSPTGRFRASPRPRVERRRSPRSRSRSVSKSRSSSGSQTPRQKSKEKSTSRSRSPPAKGGLVSYGDGSPDSSRD